MAIVRERVFKYPSNLKLNRVICKMCRIKEYGKESAWNEFAEAWAYPENEEGSTIPVGHIYCPGPLYNRTMEDAEAVAEAILLEHMHKETIDYVFNMIQDISFETQKCDKHFKDSKIQLLRTPKHCPRIRITDAPPFFCPHKEAHREFQLSVSVTS